MTAMETKFHQGQTNKEKTTPDQRTTAVHNQIVFLCQ